MPFNIYNLKNQSLNADKNRELSYFSTNNFGGILSESYDPIKIVGNTITWEDSLELPVCFMGGGSIIECSDKLNYTFNGTANLYALEVTLNTDNATIAHNRLENKAGSLIKFKAYTVLNPKLSDSYSVLSVVNEPKTNPRAAGYYIYDGITHAYRPAISATLQPGVVYYNKVTSQSLTFTLPYGSINKSLVYYGNSVWINNETFIIPLCVKTGNTVSSVVSVATKEDIDGLMSMANYKRLKDYIDSNFVWHEGGQGMSGESIYNKGDIGSLNITHNVIAHKDHLEEDMTEPVKITDLAVMSLASKQNSANSKVMVDPDGRLSVDPFYKTPVSAGGTYVPNNWNTNNPKLSAKQNIGINYGSGEPVATNNTMEGDIYFRIVDGSEIEPPKKVEPVVTYNYDYSWVSSLAGVGTATVAPEPEPDPVETTKNYNIKVTTTTTKGSIKITSSETVSSTASGNKSKGTTTAKASVESGGAVIIKATAKDGYKCTGFKDADTGKKVTSKTEYTIDSLNSNVNLVPVYTKVTTKKK